MVRIWSRHGSRERSRAAHLVVVGLVFSAMVLGTAPGPARAAIRSASVRLTCHNLTPTGFDRSVPWPQQQLDYQRVWQLTQGAGVTVAVVDTGVDGNQPFLRGAVLPGIDIANGGGPANTDCDGHGTFVAGLIAGRRLPGFGFAGIAPKATILPVRQANSTQDGTSLHLAASIIAAAKAGASVINVSIVTSKSTPTLARAVKYALSRDVVIVAAAGNDYSTGNKIQYPAGYKGVLAVGAVDSNGQRASFSESGPDISIVAPGVNLIGPGAGGAGLVTANGGTSYAAPFVAGVAALVRSYHPRLTAVQVIRRIEATADHPAGSLPDPSLGWGEVDPYAAVTAVLPGEDGGATVGPGSYSLPPPRRPAAPRDTAGLAAAVILVAALLASVILLGAGIVRRAALRGWRPGSIEDLIVAEAARRGPPQAAEPGSASAN